MRFYDETIACPMCGSCDLFLLGDGRERLYLRCRDCGWDFTRVEAEHAAAADMEAQYE